MVHEHSKQYSVLLAFEDTKWAMLVTQSLPPSSFSLPVNCSVCQCWMWPRTSWNICLSVYLVSPSSPTSMPPKTALKLFQMTLVCLYWSCQYLRWSHQWKRQIGFGKPSTDGADVWHTPVVDLFCSLTFSQNRTCQFSKDNFVTLILHMYTCTCTTWPPTAVAFYHSHHLSGIVPSTHSCMGNLLHTY